VNVLAVYSAWKGVFDRGKGAYTTLSTGLEKYYNLSIYDGFQNSNDLNEFLETNKPAAAFLCRQTRH
jgi:hypothetical protein